MIEKDLIVEYGEKMDLEIELSDDDYEADWVILRSELPPGLEMDKDDDEVENRRSSPFYR